MANCSKVVLVFSGEYIASAVCCATMKVAASALAARMSLYGSSQRAFRMESNNQGGGRKVAQPWKVMDPSSSLSGGEGRAARSSVHSQARMSFGGGRWGVEVAVCW